MRCCRIRLSVKQWGAGSPARDRISEHGSEVEAGSGGVLRSGAVAAIYQLPDRATFLAGRQSRNLRRMAKGHPLKGYRVALSARAVLPGDVLVLWLSYLGCPSPGACRCL